MSKAGSFLGGLGMGAAAGYSKKKGQAGSDARIAARIAGQPAPVAAPSLLDSAIGQVKQAFNPAAPAADNRPTFNVSLAEQAALAPPRVPAADPPSPETEAFNDDATVPNEPIPFKNSYAG